MLSGFCCVTCFLVIQLVFSLLAGTICTADEQGLPAAGFDTIELEDFDCDLTNESVAAWNHLRALIRDFDEKWHLWSPPPALLCPVRTAIGQGSAAMAAVLSMPGEAADECPLGAIAVVVVWLACSANCGSGPDTLVAEAVWSKAISRLTLPYLLGTSAWRVASLMAKWSWNCTRQSALPIKSMPEQCLQAPLPQCVELLNLNAELYLAPLLRSPNLPEPNIIYEPRVDQFAKAVQHEAEVFGLTAGGNHDAVAASCPLETILGGVLLLFIRLLGSTVQNPSNDPLSKERLQQLVHWIGSVSLATMLHKQFAALAMLGTMGWISWRSQRLFSKSQVRVVEVQRMRALLWKILAAGSDSDYSEIQFRELGSGGVIGQLPKSPWARQLLWKAVIAASSGKAGTAKDFGDVWNQVTSWLLQGPENAFPVVCLTMCFGSCDWEQSFLHRALQVGIQRLVFISPGEKQISSCKAITAANIEVAWRLLCVKAIIDFERPYDFNNYSKFFLIPLLLSLGVGVVWLDIDIFLIQEPASWLYGTVLGNDVDVLTTDHFHHVCLNHGVFIILPSDRALLWTLRYIAWLHMNPFGHDQNVWDAFARHSNLFEPMVPKTTEYDCTKHGVLDVAVRYVTLAGWAGRNSQDLNQAILLHMTPSSGNKQKRSILSVLFNATVGLGVTANFKTSRHRERGVVAKVLLGMRRPPPVTKTPSCETTYPSIDGMLYSKLFR